MKLVLRYLAYLVFALVAVGALLFWFLGNALGDPTCHFEANGCPQPSIIHQALAFALGIGAVPLTILAFIFFRKLVRRFLDVHDRGWNEE